MTGELLKSVSRYDVKIEIVVLVNAVKIFNAARDTVSLYLDTATRNISKQNFVNAVI